MFALAVAAASCADTATESTPVEVAETTDSSTTTAVPSTSTAPELGEATDRFPTVVGAEAAPEGNGTWRFDVTISSPYDTPERYADAWRVLDGAGNQLGIRVLAHDHAGEQPFTRSLAGVAIPAEVTEVQIEPRDLANGWSGETVTIELEEDDNG